MSLSVSVSVSMYLCLYVCYCVCHCYVPVTVPVTVSLSLSLSVSLSVSVNVSVSVSVSASASITVPITHNTLRFLCYTFFSLYLSSNPRYLFLQGPSVYPIEEMAAGNIVAILGLEVRTFDKKIALLDRAEKKS